MPLTHKNHYFMLPEIVGYTPCSEVEGFTGVADIKRVFSTLGWFLVVWLGPGCGGGGGGNGVAVPPTPPPPADPFGLTSRPPLAVFDLPGAGIGLGTYNLVAAFPNLDFPNALFLAGVPRENRLVVVRQSGQVHAFVNDPGAVSTSIVLDLSSRVLFGGEQGLLGLAFDPDFVTNRFLYVHYSDEGPRRSVIARFTWMAGPDTVDLSTEKTILEITQPFSNHNGGMLAFGPDDYLYIGMGDGGSGGDPNNNAQNPANPLGSMLRVDVHPTNPGDPYDVPIDNPFIGEPGFMPETYAYGLRNPFRYSFDRQSGDLWLGDVGQGEIEEIDIITAGGNYGWRFYEGTQEYDNSGSTPPNPTFIPPIFEYSHASGGVAVIGGYVYRGNRLPGLQGRYLYTDFGSGALWALDWDGTNVLGNDQIAQANTPTSFGEDNQGEVFVVSSGGTISQLEEASGGGNLPDLLSETGLFTDFAQLTPASGLIEYDLNHPFWSDATSKRRWVAVPDSSQIGFTATDAWNFPEGSFVVKHFDIELTEGDETSRRKLETRILIHTQNGWQGFTYRWNAGETDAILLTGRETESITVNLADGGTRDQLYTYPSRTDCLGCHTQAAGFTLGLKTRQLNRNFDYPDVTDNQLRSLNNIGLFSTDIGAAADYQAFAELTDSSIDIATRARTYLDVNCALCHQPGGPTPLDLDLRFDIAIGSLNAIGRAPAVGDLGIVNAEIIASGEKERSVLWQRMRLLGNDRMPPLASDLVDTRAVDVVGEWIDSL